VRFDQLFSDVARDLKRLLNSTPLSDEPLHLVAS
jgi:predicted component of type VI protein secretion system